MRVAIVVMAVSLLGCASRAPRHETSWPQPPRDPRIEMCRRLGDGGGFLPGSIARRADGTMVVAGEFLARESRYDERRSLWADVGEGGFVAALNTDGSMRWATPVVGRGEDVSSLAASPDGRIAVVGSSPTPSTGAFDTGTRMDFRHLGGPVLSSPTFSAAYALAIEPDGKHRWSTLFGGHGYLYVPEAGFDAAGRLVVVGRSDGDMTVGSAKLEASPQEQSQVFVTQLDTAGKVRWLRRLPRSHLPLHLAVDADGGSVLLMTRPADRMPSLFQHVLWVRLDPEGNVLWTRPLDENGLMVLHDVTFGAKGEIVASGALLERPLILETPDAERHSKALVAKFSSDGELLWSSYLGARPVMAPRPHLTVNIDVENPEKGSVAYHLVVDAAGEITLTGLHVVSEPGPSRAAPHERRESFVARLDASGALRWRAVVATNDTAGLGIPLDIALDATGHPVVVGAGGVNPTAPCGGEPTEQVAHLPLMTGFVARLAN